MNSTIANTISDPTSFKAVVDYGLAIVGLFFITKFLVWLVRYILEKNEKREDSHMSLLTGDVKKASEAMTSMVNAINSFKTSVEEAHKYQREEHNKILDNQGKIGESLIKVNDSLGQVSENLGRINGYKHD
uniref:Uncharacterized protein n=1 Tax=viral metagenome TaxID=1070528 RepID=A0A6M3JRH3_9ZZZZ